MSAQHADVLKAILVLLFGLAACLVGMLPQSRFREDYVHTKSRKLSLLIGGIFASPALCTDYTRACNPARMRNENYALST